ncbi:hypothetical protein [Roseobacter sinensis]|uniref:Uncharacterized protein n=1 Tax=Roseobacter sinensis TaxID=2931391 RepID=A0ABT3BIS0_9RHOB|nr:hypothetical protein [Roseobacter sp. WL0113]MCV3273472.1 hypothetical protein [Roseobacter sp. WL0113]
MTRVGPLAARGCLAALAGAGVLAAVRLWPKEDPEVLEHTHDTLPLDHRHRKRERRHAHPVVLDDRHPYWRA